MSAHTPAEWAAMFCLAVSGYGAFSAPYFVLVDADLADFDPRPALARAVESGVVDPLLIRVGPALVEARAFVADARQYTALSLRDAALSAAALLALLFPTAGGTR